jgi:hypothetical protein
MRGIKELPISKKCGRCNQSLPLGSFYKRTGRKNSWSTWCLDCYNMQAKEKRKENVELVWGRNLKYKYGSSIENYKEMEVAQKGRCAICGDPPTKKFKFSRFDLDHDHITKKVRGLLCNPCNMGLGNFKDSAERLEKAVIYLKKMK